MNEQSPNTRIEALLPSFEPGAVLLRTWPLDGGISSQMTALELRRPSGEVVRRIARQANLYTVESDPYPARREFETLKSVRRAGIRAPEPIYLEPLEGSENPPIYILEFLEGAPNLSPQDPEAYITAYASELARIHSVDLSQGDWSFIPSKPITGPSDRDGAPNEELLETEIRAALKAFTPKASNPVLRHGDFWPGNVIWQSEQLVGVIDWEEACIGDPLADLAICRLDTWWVLGPAASKAFTEEYQRRTGLPLDDLPYWDLWASLRPIRNIHEWAGSYPGLGRPDITTATMTAGHRAFVDQALGNLPV